MTSFEPSHKLGDLPLEGHVALVTGSSSGIGQAIALELALAGADVAVHARANSQGAEATAAKVRQLGRRSDVFLCDLAEIARHEPFVDEVWRWSGGVDIWINNAGADVLTGAAAKLPFEKKLQLLWQVDVTATVILSRLVGRRMKANQPIAGRATIINTGWDQAEHGMEGDSGEMFAAAKGAVMAFTRSLAKSLAPQVRVNCVAPGWIQTAWGNEAPEYWRARAIRESLTERWGRPEDVAHVVRFLVSPDAAFITGQIVAVNGGFRGSVGHLGKH